MHLTLQRRLTFFWGIAIALCANTAKADNSDILNIGSRAKSAGAIEIPLNRPTALNFKSKADILRIRKAAVNKMPVLLQGQYDPSEIVFGGIEDNRSWWGMDGSFVWGAGNRSLEGDSEESRFLVNPFILVGANSGSALIWQPKSISPSDLKNPNFPFCWLPASLRWYPAQSMMQVTYDITSFNREIFNRRDKLILPTVRVDQFGLIAYNARDFGFNYIYLDCNKSINVTNSVEVTEPVLISQMIHCGGSSQYPGGCNNMSPAIVNIDRIAFTKLPARAKILLWKEQPADLETPADMTCLIDFH